ncbi:hypothetical protein FRC07_010092 [Ceratobasidium sp. 392]|nr:hypothetical protein FRC07_010092 [Ceratobasidium sp. 392]
MIVERSPSPEPRPRFGPLPVREREPATYADGEPTPQLHAVGPNASLATGRLASAVGRAKMMNALGGAAAKKPAGPVPVSPLTFSEESVVHVSNGGDKGKGPAPGERAGPSSHHHGPHVHLHGSNVPLQQSETERVYVPFTDEVIRDVGRPRRHPEVPYPGFPEYQGYPPYYPYPYPYPYETEYSDASDDEHGHHHHHHPHDRHHHGWERERRHREFDHNRDHHHHEHEHHHRRPRHPPFFPPPPWFNPLNPSANPWSAAYNPAPPSHHRLPFTGPLYASIPSLPPVFDQTRSTFFSLPVQPNAMLRDLQEQFDRQVPAESAPPARAAPNPADDQYFLKGFFGNLCKATDLLKALPVLAYQECQPFYIDAVYRRLSNMVQVRFAERRGEDIINRVHLVQRNRLAYGAVMQYRAKLDVDLVLPGDYILRRWAVNPKTPDTEKPRSIAKALKLDAATIPRAEIDAADLGWVIKAVLAQLNGSVDQFIFPGGADEAKQYLGSFDDSATTDGVNRIRLMSVSNTDPIRVNVFVKVAIELNGQEMVVGVDQASGVSAGKYQMVKLLRQPNGTLGESSLPPIERSALIALGWWKRGIAQGDVPTKSSSAKPKVRASHFGIALKALHALDPIDELYVPQKGTQVFSFSAVSDVMWKIASYLKRAYESPALVASASSTGGAANLGASGKSASGLGPQAEYMFPLASCGIMEALYTQASVDPAEIQTLTQSGVLDDLISKLAEQRPKSGDSASAQATPAPAAPNPATTSPAGPAPSKPNSLFTKTDLSVTPGGLKVAGGVSDGSSSASAGLTVDKGSISAANFAAKTPDANLQGSLTNQAEPSTSTTPSAGVPTSEDKGTTPDPDVKTG